VGSAYSNTVQNVAAPGVPTVPVAPTGLTVAIASGVATLNWSHPGGVGLIDFTIQRATNATFTVGVSSLVALATATTAQDTVTGAGPFYYRIRANGSAGSSAWTNASPFPVGGVLTVISLTANRTFPFVADGTTSMTWTAVATGGAPPLEYQFWRYSYATGLWTVVQPYSLSIAFAWTPSVTDAGQYIMGVWVRSVGNPASFESSLTTPAVTITGAPVSILSLSPNVASPAPAGTAITWTALASGGVAPLQFEFWRYNYATGVWSVVQPYSPTNTYTWTPAPGDAGTYIIGVWVAGSGFVGSFEASATTTAYVITP
jgi:hypothetical protein